MCLSLSYQTPKGTKHFPVMKPVRPSKELINTAKSVVLAKAKVSVLYEKVTKIKTDLLFEVNAIDEDGNTITDEKLAYLMADECASKYYELFDQKIKEAGFDVPAGYCPLLMAENDERKLSRKMNELAMDLVKSRGISIDIDKIYNPDDLKKLTDLNLKYILQFA